MYHAVNERVAICLEDLNTPISPEESPGILHTKGFSEVHVDIVTLARSCIGNATYRIGAKMSEAPTVFDCSSFTKWLYAQKGICIPRRSVQQLKFGSSVSMDDLQPGDLVVTTGCNNYYISDPSEGVGHVGIATGQGTVIHAASRKQGVIETKLSLFIRKRTLRGIRRILPEESKEVITLQTPPEREIESSDDLQWIILESLPE